MNIVGSVNTNTDVSNEDKFEQAGASIGQLLHDVNTGRPEVANITIDLSDINSVSSSVSAIVDKTIADTGSTISVEAKDNIASIASSVVTKVKEISTESNDISTFAKLEELTAAANNIVESVEASGVDLSLIHI